MKSNLYRPHFWTLLLVGLFTLFILGLLLSSETAGDTLTVDDDAPADYSRIEYAVENATTGDMIQISGGTYQDNIRIQDEISITSSNETVILSGNIHVDPAGNLTMEHILLVFNCSADGEYGVFNNGYLTISNSTLNSLDIWNCYQFYLNSSSRLCDSIFANPWRRMASSWWDGKGIICQHDDIIIRGCTIRSDFANISNAGSAGVFLSYSNAIIDSCIVANVGKGIIIEYTDHTIIRKSEFKNLYQGIYGHRGDTFYECIGNDFSNLTHDFVTTEQPTVSALIVNSTFRDSHISAGCYVYQHLRGYAMIQNCTVINVTGNDPFYLARVGDDNLVEMVNTTVPSELISISNAGARLLIRNYLSVVILDHDGTPAANAEVLVMDNNNTVYSTPYFGGSDPTADGQGIVQYILVTDSIYNNSNVSIENTTKVYVIYNNTELKDEDLNMSQPRNLQFNFPRRELLINVNPEICYLGGVLNIHVNHTVGVTNVTLDIQDSEGYLIHQNFLETNLTGYVNFVYLPPMKIGEYTLKVNTTLIANQTTFTVIPKLNAPPVISSVNIVSSDAPHAFETSILQAEVNASDPEKETLFFVYNWFIDDVPLGLNRVSLNGSYFQKGDLISLNVSVSDSENTTYMEAPFTILINNSIPILSGLTILPVEPTTTSDLTLSYMFIDGDNDEDRSTIEWFVDSGDGWKKSPVVGSTVPAIQTLKGQKWKCVFIPFDGEDPGATVESENVTINNAPPVIIISEPLDLGEFPYNREIIFDGSDSYDADGDALTFTWTIQGGQYFDDSFTLNLSPGGKTITLEVNDGNISSYRQVHIKVYRGPDLVVDPDGIMLTHKNIHVGSNIEISINVRNNGDTTSATTVYIYLSLDKTVLLGKLDLSIDSGGETVASLNWEPLLAGEYDILVEVTGIPSDVDPSNNQAQTELRVREGSEDETTIVSPTLMIMGVATVGIVGFAIYGYDPLKIRFWSLVYILYTREGSEKRVFEREYRSLVFDVINDNPGINHNEVQRVVNQRLKKKEIGNGSLAHAIRVLERTKKIREIRVSNKCCYWRHGIKCELANLTPIQRSIYTIIDGEPGLDHRELAERIGKTRQTLANNVKVLKELEMIYDIRDPNNRKRKQYYTREYTGRRDTLFDDTGPAGPFKDT